MSGDRMKRAQRWSLAWVVWAAACTPTGSGDDVAADAAVTVDARPMVDAVVITDAASGVEDARPGDMGSPPDAARDAARPADMARPAPDMAPQVDARAPRDAARPVDAAPAPDAGPVEPGPCPEREYVEGCVFGETTGMIRALAHLEIVEVARLRAPGDLSPLQGRQLVHGVGCEGFFMPQTVEEAFELTDDGVRVLQIQRLDTGARFDWLRVYMGDTEVGYIYFEGTLQLAAIVGDGDIHHCTVAR